MHLGDELLSAYLDGELSPSEATAAATHLGECASCASALRLFGAVDEHVAASPALSCSVAEAFLSAKLDGELGPEEAAMASAHLSDCAACRADVHQWSVLEQTLAAMPVVAPSRRVDVAMAKLGEQRQVRVPRLVGAWPLPTLAVVTAISLVLVLSLPQGGPNVAVAPNAALVAAVQQSVLNPNTNTLYVLFPDQATVAALDAKTYAQKAVAYVSGRPTALALNLTTNTVIVLDASTKTVTEIDGASMAVTSATQVSVPGMPTSVQVDPKSGDLRVSSVVTPTAGPSATPGAAPTGVGVISMIDGGTKKVDAMIQVDVAPQIIVIEPNGRRALLVSAKQTILADAATYSPLASAVGGVSAAFQIGGDNYAVLSNSGSGAVLTYGRGGANLAIGGTPHAVAALPGGGFAVLTDAAGRGVITLLTADGLLAGTMDAPAGAVSLSYDAEMRKFAVIGTGGVFDVALPSTLGTAAVSSPNPNPAATSTPLPTAVTTPAPSATPVPTQPAVVVAPQEKDDLVPLNARPLWPGTYFVSVSTTQRPARIASDRARIWYLDDANRVNTFRPETGELLQVAVLPPSATIASMAVGPSHVYFVDGPASALYSLSISTLQYVRIPLTYATGATAIAASPDDRLWLATGASGLVGYDPRTGQIQRVPVGTGLAAVATDALGRVWTAGGDRQAVDVYDPLSGKTTEYALTHGGSITALTVDPQGTVWVGTDTGQVFSLRAALTGGLSVTGGLVGRAVTDFVLDQNGATYYVSRSAGVLAYGALLSPATVRTGPVDASEPMFDFIGRAWQGSHDGGGFYVTLPGGR